MVAAVTKIVVKQPLIHLSINIYERLSVQSPHRTPRWRILSRTKMRPAGRIQKSIAVA